MDFYFIRCFFKLFVGFLRGWGIQFFLSKCIELDQN